MNLSTTLELYAGGQGSGCDPDAARQAGNKCGRPPKGQLHPTRYTKMVWRVPEGGKEGGGWVYTLLKPSRRGAPEGKRGLRDLAKSMHGLRGTFALQTSVENVTKGFRTSVFEARPIGGKIGQGTVLFVHRDMKRGKLKIREVTMGEFAHISQTEEFSFRNFLRGQAFLKKRYGVTLKLPPMRGSVMAQTKSLSSELRKLENQEIMDLVEKVFEKYKEEFKVLKVQRSGKGKPHVRVRLRSGKEVEVQL